MKKIMFCIVLAIAAAVIILLYRPQAKILTESDLTYKSYPVYIDCEQLLNDISSDRVTFLEAKNQASEQVYNALSTKTKSWYTENHIAYDTKVKVINQQIDLNDSNIVYIDVLYFFKQPEQDYFDIYSVWYAQIMAVRKDSKWMLVKYYDLTTKFEYSDIEQVTIKN